ncbi:MAG: type III-B CRISPR-associated protein Cas10/Cmr2 [Bacteroidetes bacterium]|nr:type III-B CRISPR-associated protein Cas10/Cmr2 [Bacteroidota bacterium]
MDCTEETAICETDWRRVLQAWMHDPVDKALSIRGHTERAKFFLSAALDGEQNVFDLERSSKSADIIASTAERLPMPKAGRYGERAVGISDGPLQIFHPVSAQPDELNIPNASEDEVSGVIKNIVCSLPMDPRLRFLALWRLLPRDLYRKFGLDFTRLPADTRVPDHSLIQHADITSGIQAASQFGRDDWAILSVTLGPVQSFIEAARSVRDLWSGSALLSWLIFQGIRPIIRDLGPTVMVFPALRGNPLTDLWLREISHLKTLIPEPLSQARRAPSLPNRFVALVPNGKDGTIASAFANASRTGICTAWKRLADQIRDHLNPVFSSLDSGWAKHWDSQIGSFFEVTTSICPVKDLDEPTMASLIGGKQNFGEVWKDARKVRSLHEDIPLAHKPRYKQNKAGQWQAQLEVSARIAEAQRSIRHVPQVPAVRPAGPKCSLLGTYEQMGPASPRDSAEFWRAAWESGIELRKRERFCAVALCKRFAPKQFLRYELDLCESDLRFPDTAIIAASEWLQRVDFKVKNGQWLHQRQRCEDDESVPPDLWKKIKNAKKSHGSPPSYYAILAMDADDMGLWLKGEKAPYVKEIIHPKLREYFKQRNAEGLEAKRPVGPALHGAISEALNNFASFSAPSIVEDHCGTLIYSGGDDVLALLPARSAIRCALALRKAFCGQNGSVDGWAKHEDKHVLAMGNRATLSAGIAFVHVKEDLRGALRAAREAEKRSKDQGKNRLTLKFMRRSGERPSCDLPWELACWFQEAIETFRLGVSDRWIYQLRREEPVLSELPFEAMDAEIRRLIKRSEAMDDGKAPADAMPIDCWWSHFTDHAEDYGQRLKHFVHLCLGASFIARGFDGR